MENFDKLLDELKELIANENQIKSEELTIFDIGGRGYYENPSSDILAFYLIHPQSELQNEFENVFYKVFFGANRPKGNIQSVEREVSTNEGNRIDLLVKGGDYVIVIENKIHHFLSNPLDDYERTICGKFVNKNKYYFILADEEPIGIPKSWKYIPWTELLNSIDDMIKKMKSNSEYLNNKWLLFLEDFVKCLKNEFNIDGYHMNKKIRKFFNDPEKLKLANKLIKFRNEYLKSYIDELKEAVNGFYPIHKFPRDWGTDGFAYYIGNDPQKSDRPREIAFILTYNEKWKVRWYYWTKENETILLPTNELSDITYWTESKDKIYCAEYKSGFASLKDAIDWVKKELIESNKYEITLQPNPINK